MTDSGLVEPVQMSTTNQEDTHGDTWKGYCHTEVLVHTFFKLLLSNCDPEDRSLALKPVL